MSTNSKIQGCRDAYPSVAGTVPSAVAKRSVRQRNEWPEARTLASAFRPPERGRRYRSAMSLPPATRPIAVARNFGFTLIELMAVLAIIGIMIAMIIPEMRGSYNDALLRSSSRELMSVCNLACSQAIAANQTHRVQLDPITGKYFVEKRVRGGATAGGFMRLRDLPGGDGTIDRRISIQVRSPGEEVSEEPSVQPPPSSANNSQAEPLLEAIGFYSDGTADAREILLQDRDGFRMALRINAVTAHVSAVEMERK